MYLVLGIIIGSFHEMIASTPGIVGYSRSRGFTHIPSPARFVSFLAMVFILDLSPHPFHASTDFPHLMIHEPVVWGRVEHCPFQN